MAGKRLRYAFRWNKLLFERLTSHPGAAYDASSRHLSFVAHSLGYAALVVIAFATLCGVVKRFSHICVVSVPQWRPCPHRFVPSLPAPFPCQPPSVRVPRGPTYGNTNGHLFVFHRYAERKLV